MKDKNIIKIRPYARLLTMLGDQLISNEQTAVIELIKNSYDADAEWVKVTFENFGDDKNKYKILPKSKIVIEDNGCGMTTDIIQNAWMNPATPIKANKRGNQLKTPIFHRIIQGEKGIGRYAMLKLGKTIEMVTRPKAGTEEYSVTLDFHDFDDDFKSSEIINKEFVDNEGNLFLDGMAFELKTNSPQIFIAREVILNQTRKYSPEHNAHGTKITISNLRGSWNETKIKRIYESFIGFSDLFSGFAGDDKYSGKGNNFDIEFCVDDKNQLFPEILNNNIKLKNIIDNYAVLKITDGKYFAKEGLFEYFQNGIKQNLRIDNPSFTGITEYKDHFEVKNEFGKNELRKVSEFGDFSFDFYIFDFTAKEADRFSIPENAKEQIKQHRIYLLRDNVRVLPYGDPSDDWLMIDTNRGTVKANWYFSNDQVIGRVKISKECNPHLKDKTNREGLIDEGEYTSDFKTLLSVFLSYIRRQAYQRYIEEKRHKQTIDNINRKIVKTGFDELKEYVKDDKKTLAFVRKLQKGYETEKKYNQTRLYRTESLAGVGLSVETASHDIMMILNNGVGDLMELHDRVVDNNYNVDHLKKELKHLVEEFQQVHAQMKDMQLMFTSSNQSAHNIKVIDIIEKVANIYKRVIKRNVIQLDIREKGSPLIVKCTDADLLQLFINLLDNSIYWLNVKGDDNKVVRVIISSKDKSVVFSDNGTGVNDNDKPYIFEPFYSSKGVSGKGLGLYISKLLMNRNGYDIRLSEEHDDGMLSGANFIIKF